MGRKEPGRASLLTCSEARERFYPLLLRTLLANERLAILDHTQGCETCRLALQAVRGRLARIDGLRPAEVDVRKPHRSGRRRYRTWLALLPAVPAAIAFWLLLQQGIHDVRYRYEQRFLTRLQKALLLYRDDFGAFPPSDGAPLAVFLSTTDKHGPYLNLASERMDGSGHFIDGWGHRYIYRHPGVHNPRLFDLQGFGANGKDDGGRGDDIANWD